MNNKTVQHTTYTVSYTVSCLHLLAFSITAIACGNTLAQMNIPNPLIRPAKVGRPAELATGPDQPAAGQAPAKESKPAPEPAEAKSSGVGGSSGATTPSVQESFNLQQQQLNSDRIPAPLRQTLANVVVTAMVGDLAVLRQQIAQPVVNNPLAGTAGMNPNQTISPVGQNGIAQPGQLGQVNLNNPMNPGYFPNNSTAQQPVKPFSIRVRHGQVVNIAGYNVRAVIQDGIISLLWKSNQGAEYTAYYASIETGSLSNYVPPSNVLERRDPTAYERVTPNNTSNTTGISATASGNSSNTAGAGSPVTGTGLNTGVR